MLDQNEIEIVMYGYSNDKIRFYMTTDSMDDAIPVSYTHLDVYKRQR